MTTALSLDLDSLTAIDVHVHIVDLKDEVRPLILKDNAITALALHKDPS